MSGIEETALKSQLAGLLALLAAVIRLSFFPSTVTVFIRIAAEEYWHGGKCRDGSACAALLKSYGRSKLN